MINLTDYKLTEELYNVTSNVANYTSTLSTSFLNATYNFNYSGIPATAENFVFNDAPATINAAAENVKSNAFIIKENLAQFVTEDAPRAIYDSAANAVNHVYAAGSYISDSIVSARDAVTSAAQEYADTAYTTAESITEQCNANQICANAIDAAPYVAAGVAALATVGVAYKLYGYMQATEAQDSLIDMASNEEDVVKVHVCQNHDHHNHVEAPETQLSSPKLVA